MARFIKLSNKTDYDSLGRLNSQIDLVSVFVDICLGMFEIVQADHTVLYTTTRVYRIFCTVNV